VAQPVRSRETARIPEEVACAMADSARDPGRPGREVDRREPRGVEGLKGSRVGNRLADQRLTEDQQLDTCLTGKLGDPLVAIVRHNDHAGSRPVEDQSELACAKTRAERHDDKAGVERRKHEQSQLERIRRGNREPIARHESTNRQRFLEPRDLSRRLPVGKGLAARREQEWRIGAATERLGEALGLQHGWVQGTDSAAGTAAAAD
jgi:hypothetical protein